MNSDIKNKTLDEISSYVNERMNVNELHNSTYISTENMLPNKAGITDATTLPNMNLTSAFKVGDVLVSNIRPYFKKIWQATFDGGCSNDVLVFRAKDGTDSKYLYYVLSNDKFFHYSMSTSKGTKMPRGDKKSLMEYSVPDINTETQRKIAKVLSAIDDKIELNNSINNNLEQQAQAMFLQSIRTSNFNNVSLINVSTIKYGKGLPTSKLVQSGYKVFGGNGVIGYHTDYMYEKPQILISCRGAASGTIQESYPYSFITNNSLIIELEDRRYYEFIKQYLFLNQLHSYATGSAQPQITIDNLKTVEVPYPDYAVIANLSDNLSVLSKKIYDNICENEILVQLRDTLLPKLMSGEIDVDKVEVI